MTHYPKSVSELLEAARSAGLSLTTTQESLDESGLDFRVVHAHDDEGRAWIVRAPRRAEVVAASRVEARVLGLVAPKLPVRVPDFRVHTEQVIAYPRLDGTPAISILPGQPPSWNIPDPTAPPQALIDSFARIEAALSAIPADLTRAAGVPEKTLIQVRDELARAMEVTRPELSPPEGIWRRWQAWLNDDALWPDYVALVHGDLHPGHLLLDEQYRVTAVLDWTEAAVTDPSVDFAMFYGCFGRAPLESLIERFVRCGGRTWPHLQAQAIERWNAAAVYGCEWALKHENPDVLAHARYLLSLAEA